MPLGQHEQVRVGLRVDVADRDEARRPRRRGRPRGRAGRRGSPQRGSEDPLLRDGGGADAHQLADGRVDEPRRVVVAVAAAGPVDEHRVLGAELRRASGAGTPRARPRAAARRAPSSRGRDGVVARLCACPAAASTGRRAPSSTPARSTRRSVRSNAALVLGREADDHVARQVEVLAAARARRRYVGDACSGAPSRAARRRRRTGAARAGGATTVGRLAHRGDAARRRRG